MPNANRPTPDTSPAIKSNVSLSRTLTKSERSSSKPAESAFFYGARDARKDGLVQQSVNARAEQQTVSNQSRSQSQLLVLVLLRRNVRCGAESPSARSPPTLHGPYTTTARSVSRPRCGAGTQCIQRSIADTRLDRRPLLHPRLVSTEDLQCHPPLPRRELVNMHPVRPHPRHRIERRARRLHHLALRDTRAPRRPTPNLELRHHLAEAHLEVHRQLPAPPKRRPPGMRMQRRARGFRRSQRRKLVEKRPRHRCSAHRRSPSVRQRRSPCQGRRAAWR